MMKIIKNITAQSLTIALIFLTTTFVNELNAQTKQVTRVNDRQVEQIIRNVERRSDTFRRSFDAGLDRSRLDGTLTEDDLNDRVKAFEEATNELRSRFDGRRAAAADVDNVLNRAALIDEFMRNNLKQARVQGDWILLKSDLQKLAKAYNVAFNINGRILPPSVVATQRAYRVTDSQVQYLLNRIEKNTDTFRSNLGRALDNSRFNSTKREDNINEFVKDFENSTDALRNKFNGKTSVGTDVGNVLVRAARIDDFMKRNLRNNYSIQREWNTLHSDLNQLANYYSLSYNLDNRRGMPSFPFDGVLTSADMRFTGTYRLNTYQSEDARWVVDNATRYLAPGTRSNIYERLVTRLTAPEMLSIERQGMRVMMESTIAPQVTLDADNREHLERYPNGRQSRVRSSFVGDTLNVTANGDRANDFTAIFTTMNNGRRLMVTRRLYAEGLNKSVEVKSYYDRISDTAQFDIYRDSNRSNAQNINDFLVPNNMVLVGVLNNNLSTKTAREGDRFTMVVRSPSRYAGAIIEGFVSNPNRSGRISGRSEMMLNYETINWNGRKYQFAALTEEVMNVNGKRLNIDNEGIVKDRNSQTGETIERTAIGSGVGAIIGAILGGGKGAIIGASTGAGVGAGSVFIQGPDDLELVSGTQLTIRASAPRSY